MTVFPGKDGLLAIGKVICLVDHMSLVREGSAKSFMQLRLFRANDFFDLNTAHDVVFSTRSGRLQAKEANDVATVGMKPQFAVGVGTTSPVVLLAIGFVSNAQDHFPVCALGYGCPDPVGQREKPLSGIIVEGFFGNPIDAPEPDACLKLVSDFNRIKDIFRFHGFLGEWIPYLFHILFKDQEFA